jgi:hypothetical protein
MNNHRQLAIAAYLVAGMLIFIPLIDASLTLFPWNLGSSQWRFGAFGLYSNALMLPAAGALIAVATAAAFSHQRMLRVLVILQVIVAAVLLISVALFGLDAVQARKLIRPDMQLSYRVASATAAIKLLLGAVTFLLLARGARAKTVVLDPRADTPRGFPKRSSGAVVGH